MEIGEKNFLATSSDLEPINTKLDTVISDTTTLKSTTKDTNNKTTSISAVISKMGIDSDGLYVETE